MSSDPAVRVEQLCKCYQIYERPRDRLLQMLFRGHRTYYREFWALRDVSFTVAQGETVGIIGRNGSGKSTLLQMICGTLHPTGGSISTRGRIAALLELGSGFNPEFTGRENVYMNASILGLSHEEIDARFNDIAAFADIGSPVISVIGNTLTISGNLLIGGGLSVLDPTAVPGTDFGDFVLTATLVPEPSSIALGSMAGVGSIGVVWRRRRFGNFE